VIDGERSCGTNLRMRGLSILPATFIGAVISVGACSASSSSPAGGGGGVEAGATEGGPQSDGGSTCDGTVANGILGTWGITRIAGGDAPGGVTTIPVKGTYRFCGSASTGTFRETDDGLHVGGRNCHYIVDMSGTFTYDNATLTLTTTSGFLAVRGCDDGSANTEQPANVPSTTPYPATVSGNELTIQDGSVSGGKPGSVYTRE
jgi:hypothetical protein